MRAYITVTAEEGADAATMARIVQAALQEYGFRHVVMLAPRAGDRSHGLFPVEKGRIKDSLGQDYQVTVTTAVVPPPKGKR
jgi:hypothetical protein